MLSCDTPGASAIDSFQRLAVDGAELVGRRTQVVKGEVCKTSMHRFESDRRLHRIAPS
jgi:hypothetical protein